MLEQGNESLVCHDGFAVLPCITSTIHRRGRYTGKKANFHDQLEKRFSCSLYVRAQQSIKKRLIRDILRTVNELLDPFVEHLLDYSIIKVGDLHSKWA